MLPGLAKAVSDRKTKLNTESNVDATMSLGPRRMLRQQTEACQSGTPLFINALHHPRVGCAGTTGEFLAKSY
jgi:hypothetical protein